MNSKHGSGRVRRGAAAQASARKRAAHTPQDTAPPQSTDTPPAQATDTPQADGDQRAATSAEGADTATPSGDAVADSPPVGGRPAAGAIALPRRVPGEHLTAWERTLIVPRGGDDPEMRALRDDLSEALGLATPPVHARTTDTLVMPAITDEPANKDRDAAGEAPQPFAAAQLTAPIPSGAPVGLAIPGRYRVEPPSESGQVTASWAAPAVETTMPLPPIPAPYVPPPAPVPVTPGLLRKIFGMPWAKVVQVVTAETDRFGHGRISLIHHVPTDEGAVATAVLYGFGNTPVVWDGDQYAGGEPREGRMHPSVVMHALASHVRDHRVPQSAAAEPAVELPGADVVEGLSPIDPAAQAECSPMEVAV